VHASEATSLHRSTANIPATHRLLHARCSSPPSLYIGLVLPLHAERTAFCMQEGGENNSPRWFLIMLGQIGSGPAIWFPSVGRTDPSPALLAGLVPAHDKTDFVWAEIDPIPLGPRLAQPSPIIYYILCILYVFCIIYI